MKGESRRQNCRPWDSYCILQNESFIDKNKTFLYVVSHCMTNVTCGPRRNWLVVLSDFALNFGFYLSVKWNHMKVFPPTTENKKKQSNWATYHNVAAGKCRRSRDVLETKRAVAMATDSLATWYNFFMDGPEECFGILVGRHGSVVVVVLASRCCRRHQRSQQSRLVQQMFPSYSFFLSRKPPHVGVKTCISTTPFVRVPPKCAWMYPPS